jgi:GT2 family glycosyltransferase
MEQPPIVSKSGAVPTVDVIISNFNSGPLLRECVASIAAVERRGFGLTRVVVLDNASTDGSCDAIEAFDLPLQIIRNAKNVGYGANCNRGARSSSADYLLFLNADARLYPHSLSVPSDFMGRAENVSVGICGVQLIDDTGQVTRSCARFPTARDFLAKALGLDRLFPRLFPSWFMVEWDHQTTRDVDHVMGAFELIRRVVFDQVAGFDERFFLYLEDVDLSLRARRAGWRIVFLSEGRAYHKGGAIIRRVRSLSLFYAVRSRVQYAFKHFGPVRGIAVLLATALVEPIVRLGWAVRRGALDDAAATISAFARLWLDLPRAIRGERTA